MIAIIILVVCQYVINLVLAKRIEKLEDYVRERRAKDDNSSTETN